MSFPAQKAQVLALGIKVAIAVYKVQCSLQVFLITNGQPIVMADYEGLILLEEHIDGVRLLDVRQQPGTNTLLCTGTKQTASTGCRFCTCQEASAYLLCERAHFPCLMNGWMTGGQCAASLRVVDLLQQKLCHDVLCVLRYCLRCMYVRHDHAEQAKTEPCQAEG